MRIFAIVLFSFLYNISNSQNSLNLYSSAIETVKYAPEFEVFLSESNPKEKNFSVSEITYPICVFFDIFKEYVNPCKSQNWLEIWPKEQVENLETLGNKKNKKTMLGFTNIENNYFIAELTIKSSNKKLLYLFEKKDDKPALIKIEIVSSKK